MNRSRTLFFIASALVVFFIIGGTLTGAGPGEDDERSLYKYLSVFTEALSLVQQAYVEDVDLETLMAGALNGTTEAMDPFSLYLPVGEEEAYFQAREVGIRLSGVLVLKERGIAFVAAVVPGSPADEAGVQVSDIVSAINGRETRLMPVWEIQELIAGQEGSELEMELIHQGEESAITLTLEPFDLPEPMLREVDGGRVLSVGALRNEDVDKVARLLREVEEAGAEGLVLDLRGLAFGDVEAAYRMAELFTRGELGTLERRGEALRTFTAEGEPLWTGRMVVLINRGTLGAAEILAKVLHQKIDAELVGERTFGYAGRQAVAELESGGRLIYTEAFYTGPDGEAHHESLQPDERVSGATRTFDERDISLRELILKRGLERLSAPPEQEEETAEAA